MADAVFATVQGNRAKIAAILRVAASPGEGAACGLCL
jgi:hypothetical protein